MSAVLTVGLDVWAFWASWRPGPAGPQQQPQPQLRPAPLPLLLPLRQLLLSPRRGVGLPPCAQPPVLQLGSVQPGYRSALHALLQGDQLVLGALYSLAVCFNRATCFAAAFLARTSWALSVLATAAARR